MVGDMFEAAFDDDSEGAGFFYGDGVIDNFFLFAGVASLHAIVLGMRDILWHEADMSHHGDMMGAQEGDGLSCLSAAFNFDGACVCFMEKALCVIEAVLWR